MTKKTLLLWGLFLIGATPSFVLAHRGEVHPTSAPVTQAQVDPVIQDGALDSVIVEPEGGYWYIWFDGQLFSILLTVMVLYFLGVGPLRQKIDPVLGFPVRPALLFSCGIAFYYLAVCTSLDEIGETYLFTAHMLQHNIIVYIIPLLILLGLPVWLVDTVLENRYLRGLLGYFVSPLVAFVLFNLFFIIWHIPSMYEWALRDKHMHDLEHFTFLASAIAMWWPVFGPSRDKLPPINNYGLQMLYIFALAVVQLPLFAYLCFATTPHYPTYIAAPRITEMSPLDDQFVGGILMKIFAMLTFISVWAHIFFRWARESSGDQEPVATPVQQA